MEQNQNSSSVQSLKFNIVFLGQSVLKYEVPLDVYNIINHIYETKKHELPPANVQLVGKIKNEHSLFFNGCGSLFNFSCSLLILTSTLL